MVAEYVDVSGGPNAYHDLMEQVWADGRGFINVEHDIVVRPGCIAELSGCPEAWCGFAYALSMGYAAYLGCTKFSDGLVRDHPAVVRDIATLEPDGTPRRYWGRLDTRLKQVLEDRERQTMHVHWPAVGHLNLTQRPPTVNCWQCGAEIPQAVVAQSPPPYRCPACGA